MVRPSGDTAHSTYVRNPLPRLAAGGKFFTEISMFVTPFLASTLASAEARPATLVASKSTFVEPPPT